MRLWKSQKMSKIWSWEKFSSLDLRENSSTLYPALKVDYALSFEEIATRFVAFCIKSSASLDIICRPWAPADYYYSAQTDFLAGDCLHGFAPWKTRYSRSDGTAVTYENGAIVSSVYRGAQFTRQARAFRSTLSNSNLVYILNQWRTERWLYFPRTILNPTRRRGCS
jgi:hypothetical protein